MDDSIKEEKYQKIVKLIQGMGCMIVSEQKADMYNSIILRLSKLSDYKDANKLARECSELAKQVMEEVIRNTYERAHEYKDKARTSKEYILAAKEFGKICGYKDSDDLALYCNKMSINMDKKLIKKRILKIIFSILCLITIIIGASTSFAKYHYANICMITGSYHSSIKTFKYLGSYKDSKEKVLISQYRKGLMLKKNDNYTSAQDAFNEAVPYKDSEEIKVEMEIQIIKNSKIGDCIKIGKYNWRLLDIVNEQALLIKKIPLSDIAYNNKSEEITWENATIRQWLNIEFLADNFSILEKNRITLSNVVNADNPIYKTDGGNNTKDYFFLLSIDEVEKYNSICTKLKSYSWLRTPGNNQSSVVFITMEGKVMDYGYKATSKDFDIYPAFWFDIK